MQIEIFNKLSFKDYELSIYVLVYSPFSASISGPRTVANLGRNYNAP